MLVKGVLIQVLVVVEQMEPVVLVKVQALSGGSMDMGSGKDWSSRLGQVEVWHFAHNPTATASRHLRSL